MRCTLSFIHIFFSLLFVVVVVVALLTRTRIWMKLHSEHILSLSFSPVVHGPFILFLCTTQIDAEIENIIANGGQLRSPRTNVYNKSRKD